MANKPEVFEIKNGALKKYNGADAFIVIPEGAEKIESCTFHSRHGERIGEESI